MSDLIVLNERTTKETDKTITQKAKRKVKSGKSVKGGNTLVVKIQAIRDTVERYIGDKRNEFLLITEISELEKYAEKCISNGAVAIDTETNSLDTLTCDIVGFSLFTKGNKPCYVPLNHKDYITGDKLSNQISVEAAQAVINKMIDAGVKFIFFNADFDIRVIRHTIGSYITPYFDCYIAARLLNENEPENKLKELHSKYVLDGKEEEFSFGELFKKVSFDLVPLDVAYLYAAKDAKVTYELYEFQLPFLTEGTEENTYQELGGVADVFWNIEMPLVTVVADMEDTGVKFDYSVQEKLSEKYHKELDEAEAKFYSELKKYTLNVYSISSPKQLAELFYDELKVMTPVEDRKTHQLKRTVDEEALVSCNHPLAESILAYRGCQKLISTYIDKMADVAKNDGRVHCIFNQVGTDTGRFSSKNPNMQNIPSHNMDIRKMFKADDGYLMIGADFSAQEMRMVAHLADDDKMIQGYVEGKDIYCVVASLAFKVPYEECKEFRADGSLNKEGKERRSKAKAICLGINYGKGVKAIGEDLGITTQEAQAIYDKVLLEFPKLKAFMKESDDMAYYKGYVTTIFGRKRRLPDIQLPKYEFSVRGGNKLSRQAEVKLTNKLNDMWFNDRKKYIEQLERVDGIKVKDNGGFIARAQRQCVNARVQGSAGDQVKMAMLKIANDPELKRLGFKILLQIHDRPCQKICRV